jgi:GntR family transcriptional regulator / MocR family aminotransferase
MSGAWELEIALDAGRAAPLWRQIADAISAAILAGRIGPGERLPGARRLSERLGVHRHTVDAGYAELVAQGWVVARQGSGTWVAEELPARVAAPPVALAAGQGFDWTPQPVLREVHDAPAGTLVMAGGQPDVRLIPARALSQAYRRALLSSGERLLSYGDSAGLWALREQIAAMLAQTRGLAIGPSQVLVTRGSQMGLALVAQALVRPGDRVAVEAMGYPPAWAALRAAGAQLVPIPVDADGLCVDALGAAHAERPLRAIYVTPHHQYPTTALLSAPRRVALLELAARERLAILEDDYDHEFQYDGRPVLPLASADKAGVVIYIGTLSKVLAPGLRVGFVVGSPAWITSLAARRLFLDRQGDQVAEAAVADLMESGELAQHVRKMRRVYAARQRHLCALLAERLGDALRFVVPLGGMAIWAEVMQEAGVSAREWSRRGLRCGVSVMEGSAYSFDGAHAPFLRLGFACLELDELEAAVDRLAIARRP